MVMVNNGKGMVGLWKLKHLIKIEKHCGDVNKRTDVNCRSVRGYELLALHP